MRIVATLLATAALCLHGIAYSQILDAPWEKPTKSGTEKTFFQYQEEFYDYWKDKDHTQKGSGYKIFKRWEYHWESRVNEDGTFPSSELLIKAAEQHNAAKKRKANVSNWESIGPFDYVDNGSWSGGQGRVNCAIEDPNNSNIIYAGAPNGGIWKSTDDGVSWTSKGDNLPWIGVSGIAVDYNNSDIIYISTGDDDGGDARSIGVWKSTDGGDSWNETDLRFTSSAARSNDIYIDPDNSNVLWVATSYGVYKTTNGGDDWYETLDGNIKDIKIKPGDTDIIYVVTRSSFYRSTDSGENFTEITSGIPNNGGGRFVIDVTPANPNYVYLVSADQDEAFQGIYRSTNSGVSFTQRSVDPANEDFQNSQAFYDLGLGVSDTDPDELYRGAMNVFKSTDGGASLTRINRWNRDYEANYTHADIHFLRFINGRLYCGSDGGLYRSDDGGATFEELHRNGIATGQFYKLAGNPTNKNVLVGGLQDNGGYTLYDGDWVNFHGADGMDAAVSLTDPSSVYCFTQYGGSFYRYRNGSNSNRADIPEEGGWITPIMADPDGTFLAGATKLYRYYPSNNSWSTTSDYDFGGNVDEIEIAESNTDVIYVIDGSDLFKSTDRAATWEILSGGGLPSATLSSIEVNQDDENEIWVTRSSSSSSGKVYHSTDGGYNWTNMSSGLPIISHNIIKHIKGSNGGLFVGNDLGVYYRDNTMSQWETFSTGLPNVEVSDIEINEDAGVVRVSTYGRGIWESPINHDSPPIIEFQADKTVICPGETVNFTDRTSGTPTSWSWTFAGGNPGSSTDKNPSVSYDTPGMYDVELSATNEFGTTAATKTGYIQVKEAQFGPLMEGFEGNFPPDGWLVNNPDGGLAFVQRVDAGRNSSSSMVMNNADNANVGEIDEILLQPVNLAAMVNPAFSFDVAYTMYDNVSQDELRVFASTDCGDTWTELWMQNHLQLETVSVPTNQSNNWIPSQNSDWKTEYIDISSMWNNNDVTFKFHNTSGYGTRIWLDNINIGSTTGIIESTEKDISVFSEPRKWKVYCSSS